MKLTVFLFLIILVSCRSPEKTSEEPPQPAHTLRSEQLSRKFPLLPLIEQQLWQQLLDAEKTASSEEANRIATTLQSRHPFKNQENFLSLGDITLDKKTRKISIPAIVRYPDAGDKRHPGELETLLCSRSGRSHETLFITDTRPLHLEILLHLAGFKKTSPVFRFRLDVVIPDHPPIPSELLMKSADRAPLRGEFLWQFTGSDFDDLYSPDQTGDFLILWQAHDSVMSFCNEEVSSGEKKIIPNKHKHLTNGKKVTLVLTPRKT